MATKPVKKKARKPKKPAGIKLWEYKLKHPKTTKDIRAFK